jgi:hypothetical protein
MSFMTIAVVVLVGVGAAIRLTVVGFGVVSAILAAVLVLWTLLAGVDAKVGLFGLGLWLLFNVSFFLGGIAFEAFGTRLALWRSRPLPMKDAKSN